MFYWITLFLSLASLDALAQERLPTPPVASSQKTLGPKAPKPALKAPAEDEDEDDVSDDDNDGDGVAATGKQAEYPEQAEALGRALSGNITLASDYVLRGLTQTNHEPSIQGGFDWEHPKGFFLGVWGSNVHFMESSASLELDFYGGYTYRISEEWKASVGISYFSFWEGAGRNSLGLPLKVQDGPFTLELDFSPDWEETGAAAWYVSAGWEKKLKWDFKVGAFLGYSILPSALDSANYFDSHVTLSRVYFGVEWGLTGVFVKDQAVNDAAGGSRAIFSVTKSL